jgi:hypothetical protein
MKDKDNYIMAALVVVILSLIVAVWMWPSKPCERSHTVISAELIPTKAGLFGGSTNLTRVVHYDDGDVETNYLDKIGDVKCID